MKGLPAIGFVIGGHAFTLTGEQYTLTVRPCSMDACMAIHTPFNMLDCLLHTELVQYSNIVLDTIYIVELVQYSNIVLDTIYIVELVQYSNIVLDTI